MTTKQNDSDDNELPSPPHTNPGAVFPEGGMKAWCTVFGVFLAQFCGFGYTSSFGVYQAFYSQHYLQNQTTSAISWIGSTASFLVTAMGPISGRMFDNGYFYHVYIAGATLVSLSIFMLSLTQPGQYYQVLVVQGLVCGVGQGLLYIPSLAILSHHFKHRRAAMFSVVASGVSLGGITHTIMLNKLLNGPLGFKTGVRISAAFVTVLLFLSCVLVRTRYSAVRQASAPTSTNTWVATKKCFTEIPALLTTIGFTCYHFVYLYPYFYFQLDSLKHGLSPSFAFYSVVVIHAGDFIGRFAAVAFLQIIGIIDLTIITTMVTAILFTGVIWLSSTASVVVLGVLYGFFSGMNIAVAPPMATLTSEPSELGVRMGLSFAIIGIGSLVGSPILGALLTRDYHWLPPALFCAAITLLGAALFIGVRFSFVRWQSRKITTQKCVDEEGKTEESKDEGVVSISL